VDRSYPTDAFEMFLQALRLRRRLDLTLKHNDPFHLPEKINGQRGEIDLLEKIRIDLLFDEV